MVLESRVKSFRQVQERKRKKEGTLHQRETPGPKTNPENKIKREILKGEKKSTRKVVGGEKGWKWHRFFSLPLFSGGVSKQTWQDFPFILRGRKTGSGVSGGK
ncbi:hypothetical protein AVEN_264547-1 [Araneus ventricosus]|uniref:Uncharacterized protein n=1 Tax=Araneus ventricosus TaxID=182803 RepID=A0A4Y2VDJ5_ARAVE|nr:hypothetical protein AVEN_256182-1 [Araneus ventricosus]GBO23333.1 hypothetical protein AVEN_142194-1 [Araneus ventricosus]GBO29638.1 hypothetical protein AVEN_264547-1 [Araneus ventricosus]